MPSKREAITAILACVPLFAAMEQRTLSRLAKDAADVDVPRGEMLFRPGEPCAGFHVLISGGVKLALPGGVRGEKVLALCGPGHTFGEASMFLDRPQLVSAETLSAARLVHVAKASVLGCIRRDPSFACLMVTVLSRQLHALVREFESHTLRSGTERVSAFLLSELPDAAATGRRTLTLPARKRVIASRLDLTQEHFSRILHDLATEKLIVVEGSAITIPDVARLRAYSHVGRGRAAIRKDPLIPTDATV